jgi:hypothetical protein
MISQKQIDEIKSKIISMLKHYEVEKDIELMCSYLMKNKDWRGEQ